MSIKVTGDVAHVDAIRVSDMLRDSTLIMGANGWNSNYSSGVSGVVD